MVGSVQATTVPHNFMLTEPTTLGLDPNMFDQAKDWGLSPVRDQQSTLGLGSSRLNPITPPTVANRVFTVYWLITTGSDVEAGINGGMMDRHFDQPVINTVEVASLTEVIERVNANGGSIVHGPNEIPEIGSHAYFKDTEGNMFGAIQASPR